MCCVSGTEEEEVEEWKSMEYRDTGKDFFPLVCFCIADGKWKIGMG